MSTQATLSMEPEGAQPQAEAEVPDTESSHHDHTPDDFLTSEDME